MNSLFAVVSCVFFALQGAALAAPSAPASSNTGERVVAIFNCKTGETLVDLRGKNRAMSLGEQRLAASGWCSLLQNPNGTFYCKSQSCTGSCKLHNIPARCSCD